MKNYTDTPKSPDSEELTIKNKAIQLSGKEISNQIIGRQYLGRYLHGFKYIISINSDGSLKGKNNYQHYDTGSWSIDEEKHTMSVKWERGWDNTTTRLYKLGAEIKMYDSKTGEWRSSLIHKLNGVQNIKKYQL